MKRLLPILTLLFFLPSCKKAFTTIVSIDIPHTPQLTVECSNFPDLANTVLGLKATKGMSDTGNCPVITNAVIQLYEENNPISNFSFSAVDDYYLSPFTAYQEGKTYKITASAPGYPSIEGSDIMPSTPGNIQMEVKQDALKMRYQGTADVWFDEIKISFDDKASTQDFYAIEIDNNRENLVRLNEFWTRGKYTLDPDVEANAGGDIGDNANVYYNKLYMPDKNFNGKRKTIVIYVDNGAIGPNPQPIQQPWFVRFDNLSAHAYQYEKTNWLYQMNNGDPFAEPVVIHNNIKNGVGSFRLIKTYIDSL